MIWRAEEANRSEFDQEKNSKGFFIRDIKTVSKLARSILTKLTFNLHVPKVFWIFAVVIIIAGRDLTKYHSKRIKTGLDSYFLEWKEYLATRTVQNKVIQKDCYRTKISNRADIYCV